MYTNEKKIRTSVLFCLFLLISTMSFSQNIAVGGSSDKNTIEKINLGSQPLDGNATLNNTYTYSACGLNYVQASKMVTTRYSPPGSGLPVTLAISGLPSCYKVEKAYVWWSVSYLASSSSAPTLSFKNTVGTTNSTTATLIGSDIDKCWYTLSYKGTRSFRADVTSFISGNGNYTLNINGNTAAEVDGMTLMIIYSDPNATYKGTLLIDDGCQVEDGGGQLTGNITNVNACGASTLAKAFSIVADFQDNVSPTHLHSMNGSSTVFPSDFWNFDEVNTTVTSGQITSAFKLNTGVAFDCYVWVARGLYFQTTTCSTCPNAPTISISSTVKDATCGSADGSITVNPTGGATPYTYVWSNGQTTATATNLVAGSYTVTVSDANGCSVSSTITVNNQGGIAVSTVSADASCGNSNGSITATVANGTLPYVYAWSNGGTSSSISNLSAGVYTLTVTDANSCIASINDTVYDAPAPVITVTSHDATCGNNNGDAAVITTGGTSPISYLWSNNQTSSSITNLAPSSYTVSVTDANGCVVTDSATISTIPGATISLSAVDAICGQNNGSASVTATGTTIPFTYVWSNGQTTTTISNLSPASYMVTVTDSNGCQTIDSITINDIGNLTASIISTDDTCTAQIGTATAVVNGGTSPYTYSWSNGAITAGISALSPGNYSVVVTDAVGCTVTASAIVNGALSFISSDFNFVEGDYSDLSGTEVSFSETSVNAMQYYWDFGDGYSSTLDNPLHVYADTGTYTIALYVTDQYGCVDSIFKTVKIEGEFMIYIPNTFSPNGDGLNDYFAVVAIGMKDIEYLIYNRWGKLVAQSSKLDYKWDGKMKTTTDKVMDVYNYRINITDVLNKKHHFQGHINLIK